MLFYLLYLLYYNTVCFIILSENQIPNKKKSIFKELESMITPSITYMHEPSNISWNMIYIHILFIVRRSKKYLITVKCMFYIILYLYALGLCVSIMQMSSYIKHSQLDFYNYIFENDDYTEGDVASNVP